MAFELMDTNLLGPAVIDKPANVIRSAANFIDPYDYAMVYTETQAHFRQDLFNFVERFFAEILRPQHLPFGLLN